MQKAWSSQYPTPTAFKKKIMRLLDIVKQRLYYQQKNTQNITNTDENDSEKTHEIDNIISGIEEKLRKEAWLTADQMKEDEVGITEYITKTEPFNALFKYRFFDFHVSEVDMEGNIAVLTNLRTPRPPNPDYLNEEQRLKVREEFGIDEAVLKRLQNIADCEQTDDVVEVNF